MANNTSGGSCGCDSSLGLPIGATGARGAASFHAMSFTIAGSPLTTSSTSYVEAGRFVFSNTLADPFTAIKTNIWVSAGTGSLRIKDLVTGNTIYENTSITSTSNINIETVTSQSVYNTTGAIVAVEIKQQNGANTISIGSSTFYYT